MSARRRPSFIVIGLGLVFLSLILACGKTAGGKCKLGESACANKTTALACRGGKLTEIACQGPMGCTMFQDKAHCDDSVASEGDVCMGASDEEYACSLDKKRALLCKNFKFERYLECRGKSGCALLGQQVSCDTSVAVKGDPCKVQGASACSENQKEMLICRDGKFAIYRYCRGQYGCYMKAEAPACDETLSVDGDPCGLPGYVVCSEDKQSELICQGSQFVRTRACRKGCVVNTGPGGGITCN